MTAQQPDKLYNNGQENILFSNPLEDFFTISNFNPGFMSPHTANYRGYVATWEIIDEKLYLIGINGWKYDKTNAGKIHEVDISSVFPDEGPPIFAKWFSGTLIIPQGKMLHYIHMGYESIYERELHITVKNGVLFEQQEFDNSHKRCC